jgi:hypothetical protein
VHFTEQRPLCFNSTNKLSQLLDSRTHTHIDIDMHTYMYTPHTHVVRLLHVLSGKPGGAESACPGT